jgi:hypothetical protein
MLKQMQRRMVAGIVALAIVLANMLLPAMPVFASHGNNGTLKVHEKGTPSGTESNDPKVCTFNFEGFGFDDYMSGYIVIKGQGQTNGTYGPYAFGPTNNHGYAQTSYFNDGIGSTTIPNGHYKATLYGKKNGQINYQDDKAKSKVFKIECAAPVKDASAGLNLTQATCESKSVASVVNLVNAALTSNGGVLDQTVGTHTATFTANAGHLFTVNDQTTLNIDYTIVAQLTGEQCEEEPTVVTPEAPVAYDYCYSDEDYIWVPHTEGVIYKANGDAGYGYYQYEKGSTVVITAEPAEGYVFSEGATTSWTFDAEDFSDKQCLEITKTAKVASDTNLDGKIGVGDTVTWEITVTNTSDLEYEPFYVMVEDDGTVLENDGYIGTLGAGESETLTATSTITEEQMAACKVVNVATFYGWRLRAELAKTEQLDLSMNKEESAPFATDSATAEYVLDCPGRGEYTPETPKTPVIPVLPYTAGASTPIVAISALSVASLILVAGAAIKSRLLA